MMHEKTRLAQDLAAAQSGTDASAADAATRARALEAEAADLKVPSPFPILDPRPLPQYPTPFFLLYPSGCFCGDR